MSQSKTTMPRQPLFQVVVAKYFFENYCPEVSNVKHKLRGIDGNGNPIDFSPEDKKKMRAAINQLGKDLKTLAPK